MAMCPVRQAFFLPLLEGTYRAGSQPCHVLALYGEHRDARNAPSVGKGEHETGKRVTKTLCPVLKGVLCAFRVPFIRAHVETVMANTGIK